MSDYNSINFNFETGGSGDRAQDFLCVHILMLALNERATYNHQVNTGRNQQDV